MAREFAKKLYQSAKWRKLRANYIAERQLIDGGLCEIGCGNSGEELHHIKPLTPENVNDPNIATNPDNLKWVCRNCHFRTRDDNFGRLVPVRETTAGAFFEVEQKDGCAVPTLREQKVCLVYGPPFSGKAAYVKKHMAHGDFVVDIGSLFDSFGGSRYDFPQNLFGNVCDIRDFVYDKISRGEINAKTIWVIESLPEKKRRDNRAKQLNAEQVFVKATQKDCVAQVYKTSKCKDKDRFLRYVTQWFEKHS
jgi:hypothetical protein